MPQDATSDAQELDYDIPFPPKMDENIKELETLIGDLEQETLKNSQYMRTIYVVAEKLADQLRDLQFRGSVGSKTKIIPNVVKAIDKITEFKSAALTFDIIMPVGVLLQLLRIVGNLVHTADCNRRQFLEADGAQVLKMTMDFLLRLERCQTEFCHKEIQISILVATNLSLEYQPAIVALAEIGLSKTLSDIVEYAYSKSLQWMSLPLILLEELVCIEAGWTMIPESLLCTLAQMTLYYATKINTEFADQDDSDLNLQLLVMSSHLLDTIVEHASPSRFTLWLFVPCDRMYGNLSDDPPVPMWLRMLMFLQQACVDAKPASSVSQEDDLPGLISIIKAQMIRALVVAVAYSTIPFDGYVEMIHMLAQLIRDKHILNDREDLVIMIGLWLGNLACDEQSCRFLVEDCEILDPLIQVLEKWTPSDSSSIKRKPGQQAQVLHAWCGLARNLAVADTYKGKLGERGMATYALECLRPEFNIVEPLNGTAAALLRHLCRNHAMNVERVVGTNQISLVVDLARRAEQPYLILESSRLLSVLINTASQIGEPKSEAINNGLKILYSAATVEALVRFAYVSVTSHQLVLINEALISLALLAVRNELTHSLCSNLIKVRDPIGSSLLEPGPLSSSDEGKQEQESTEKKKQTYKNALDALLSIWIPSSDPKEKKFTASTKPDDDDLIKAEKDLACPDEIKVNSLAENKTPIQIKQNLKVVLIQLGNQLIKHKTRSENNILDSNNNKDKDSNDDDNLVADQQGYQEIQKTLVNHFNSFHSKNPQLRNLDQNTKPDLNLEQQRPKQPLQEDNQEQIIADNQHSIIGNLKIDHGDAIDQVCSQILDVRITGQDNSNIDNYENGNENLITSHNDNDGLENGYEVNKQDQMDNLKTPFSILDVLKAWNIPSSVFS